MSHNSIQNSYGDHIDFYFISITPLLFYTNNQWFFYKLIDVKDLSLLNNIYPLGVSVERLSSNEIPHSKNKNLLNFYSDKLFEFNI